MCNCSKFRRQFGTTLGIWRLGCSKLCNSCKFHAQTYTTLGVWRFGGSKVCNCCKFRRQFCTTLGIWRFDCSKLCNCCKFRRLICTTLGIWRFVLGARVGSGRVGPGRAGRFHFLTTLSKTLAQGASHNTEAHTAPQQCKWLQNGYTIMQIESTDSMRPYQPPQPQAILCTTWQLGNTATLRALTAMMKNPNSTPHKKTPRGEAVQRPAKAKARQTKP